jgi:SAM-dependent methyltransferase
MEASMHKRTTCRLCESANIELVVPLDPIPLTEKYIIEDELNEETYLYRIDLYMCLECGHVQIMDVINPRVLWHEFTFRSAQSQMIVDHLHEVARQTCRKYGVKPGSFVIDVGSNDGTLLQGFKNQGMDVLGIDPAENVAKEAIAKGILTIVDFLTPALARQIRQAYGEANIVSCFNAFAHADQLKELATSIRDLMAPGGIFIFEAQYLVDLIDHMVLGAIIHEHLSHHSVKPMAQFLKMVGLELIDVERNHFQGGSFIGVAQKTGDRREINPSVFRHVEAEIKRGFDRPARIKSLYDRLSLLKNNVAERIKQWKEQGAMVAGYGAARSGPTLLAQLQLGKEISFIVDDHPQKVNRYTPGDKIKILPTKELCLRMPEYTIILAWVHAKKIIADNLEYLKRGGQFVVCCPEVRVIDANNWQFFLEAPSVKGENLCLASD